VQRRGAARWRCLVRLGRRCRIVVDDAGVLRECANPRGTENDVDEPD
jgi:hypothetical protein